MRAITLWQPWASLVIEGRKEYETRSWLPPIGSVGERFAIHAAARPIPLKIMGDDLHDLCMDVWGCSYNFTLPRGAVLGTAILQNVASTEVLVDEISDEERIVGDWAENRYGWKLTGIERFWRPIPAKGFQRIWKWDRPVFQAA